jgi:putative SOS response-associated peptidase YedK
MCGRYILVQRAEIIEKTFNVTLSPDAGYTGSFNISPGNSALVITGDQPRVARSFLFGLTPFWAKKPMYLINARAEGDNNVNNDPSYSGDKGIIHKPAFRKAIREQRCLVLADAFIEGTTREKLNKPYLIYLRERKPFAMAGIWDKWYHPETGEEILSFAIITTVANELLSKLPHHRSPVILEKSMESAWLSGKHLQDITWMLRPYPAELMNGYPVSNQIRNPAAEGRQLIEPLGDRLITEHHVRGGEELRLSGMGRGRPTAGEDQPMLFQDRDI